MPRKPKNPFKKPWTPDRTIHSSRLKEAQRRTILDETARNRRQRNLFKRLAIDNYHDDPHACSSTNRKLPKFLEIMLQAKPKKTRKGKPGKPFEYYQYKYRQSRLERLQADEQQAEQEDRPTFLSIEGPKIKRPPLHLCVVCGYRSLYVCIPCGARLCHSECFKIHIDTRCLQWL